MIPVEHAEFWWDEDDFGHVKDAEAFDRRIGPAAGVDEAAHPNSAGACSADWCSEGDPRETPIGIYAGWAAAGFSTPMDHIRALTKLSGVEGCDWATALLVPLTVALQDHLIPDPDQAEVCGAMAADLSAALKFPVRLVPHQGGLRVELLTASLEQLDDVCRRLTASGPGPTPPDADPPPVVRPALRLVYSRENENG